MQSGKGQKTKGLWTAKKELRIQLVDSPVWRIREFERRDILRMLTIKGACLPERAGLTDERRSFLLLGSQFPDLFLVAEANRRVVGYVVATVGLNESPNRDISTLDGDPSQATLYSMAVLHGYRRLGIGRGLVQSLMSALKKRRVKGVLLYVRSSNVAAHALYQSSGFRDSGIVQRYYRDNREDATVMTTDI